MLVVDAHTEMEDELAFSTQVSTINIHVLYKPFIQLLQVPRVGLFSEDAQLHRAIILQLKQKYHCAQHQGENGDTGHCFVGPNGEHTGLNS